MDQDSRQALWEAIELAVSTHQSEGDWAAIGRIDRAVQQLKQVLP